MTRPRRLLLFHSFTSFSLRKFSRSNWRTRIDRSLHRIALIFLDLHRPRMVPSSTRRASAATVMVRVLTVCGISPKVKLFIYYTYLELLKNTCNRPGRAASTYRRCTHNLFRTPTNWPKPAKKFSPTNASAGPAKNDSAHSSLKLSYQRTPAT